MTCAGKSLRPTPRGGLFINHLYMEENKPDSLVDPKHIDPKQFELIIEENKQYNFSAAFHLTKIGYKITRDGWNGAKFGGLTMFVTVQFPDEHSANTNPYLYIVVGDARTPWHPSNLDLFAEDWKIV